MLVMVRFKPLGESYPVNSVMFVQLGDSVIVRMKDQVPSLQRAEVVGRSISNVLCKNYIVCLAEDADAFGVGAEGVHTEEDLVYFLTKVLSFKVLPVCEPSMRYHTAYLLQYRRCTETMFFANTIFAIGHGIFGFSGPGYPNPDGHGLPLSNGVITDLYPVSQLIRPDIYSTAAWLAEAYACHYEF